MRTTRSDYATMTPEELAKHFGDRPVFILVAGDATAAATIRHWVSLNEGRPDADQNLVSLARHQAAIFDGWPEKRTADLVKAEPVGTAAAAGDAPSDPASNSPTDPPAGDDAAPSSAASGRHGHRRGASSS
jgi:hypothetical protein